MTDDEMREVLVRLDERTKDMAEDIEKLYEVVVEGNGQPSLVSQVARHDERLKSVEDGTKELRLTTKQKVAITIGGTGIFAVAAGIMHEVLRLLGH